YVAYFSMVMAGLPFFLAIPLAMIVAFIIGALVEKLLLSPIHTKNIEKPMDYALIMTFAVLLLLRKLAALVFGPFYRKPPDYITTDFHIWGVKLSGGLVLSGAASLFLILGLVWFLKYTWRGRSWRAITQCRPGAGINGVNIGRESWISCGTACALAGAAGALVAPIFLVSPTGGGQALVKSYEVMAIGGLGSLFGSLVAGLMLGVTETLGAFYISSAYRDAIGFVMMALFLLFRPQGLFGQKS
ncbi:MAG: branched-chain amino acid ABC transporter permease, partial [Desulfobacterales bacterium]|nr:branched-chain amino acid ABC transporter permease [Desulfobacterales bacterium]